MAYTTITKVREKCTQWATIPADANIRTIIDLVDGLINSATRQIFTESQASVSLIEQISTDLAAYHCVAFDVSAFETNSEAATTANLLYEMAQLGLEYLKDERIINFIKTTPVQVSPYTTKAEVRRLCTQWGIVPADANIDDFILHADGIINCAAMRVFTDVEATRSCVKEISTNLAAYYCVAFDVSAFETIADATATAKLLYEMAQLGLEYLNDARVINDLDKIGTVWIEVEDTVEYEISCLAEFDGYLYAGTGTVGKIYRSSDGTTWAEVEDTSQSIVYCLAEFDGYLYAGTGNSGKIYRSSDGTTWAEVEWFDVG